MAIKEIPMFAAVCDKCEEQCDYGDFMAYSDAEIAHFFSSRRWIIAASNLPSRARRKQVQKESGLQPHLASVNRQG